MWFITARGGGLGKEEQGMRPRESDGEIGLKSVVVQPTNVQVTVRTYSIKKNYKFPAIYLFFLNWDESSLWTSMVLKKQRYHNKPEHRAENGPNVFLAAITLLTNIFHLESSFLL